MAADEVEEFDESVEEEYEEFLCLEADMMIS